MANSVFKVYAKHKIMPPSSVILMRLGEAVAFDWDDFLNGSRVNETYSES